MTEDAVAEELQIGDSITAGPPPCVPAPSSPYIGLRPFSTSEGSIFYGRERQARILIDKIYSSGVTLFYGKSGLGKSSLINAKVIPELKQNDVSVLHFDRWASENPSQALRDYLIEEAEKAGIKDASVGVPTATELVRLLCYHTNKIVAIFFDQFEELLAWHQDTTTAFKDQLADLIQAKLDVRIIISMREEYLASLEPFRSDIHNLFRSTYRLQPLEEDGIREVIICPLAGFGGSCEPELVDMLIKDLKNTYSDGPDGTVIELPMLQLICNQLWESASALGSKRLTVELYLRQYSVSGILDEYVRSVVPKSRKEQRVAADLLRCLAPPSGLKMSFSVDDLENLSELDLTREAILEELKRLESKRIIKVREFKSARRFELLHDAFIPILKPWSSKIREREAIKKSRIKTTIFLIIATGITVLCVWSWFSHQKQKQTELNLREEERISKAYRDSVTLKLATSKSNLDQSIGKITNISGLLTEYENSTNPHKNLEPVKSELESLKEFSEANAILFRKDVETEARSLEKAALPPVFHLLADNNQITLTGKVSDLPALDNTIEIIESEFSEFALNTDALRVDATIANIDWLVDILDLSIKLKTSSTPFSLDLYNLELAITGLVPTNAIRESFTQSVNGFLPEHWQFANRLKIPPLFMVQSDGSTITISGELANQQAIIKVSNEIQKVHPAQNIVNQLRIGELIDQPSWINDVSILSKYIVNLGPTASITYKEGVLEIAGVAINDQYRIEINKEAEKRVPKGWSLNNLLYTPPTLQLVRDGLTIRVGGVMPNQQMVDATKLSIDKNLERLALKTTVKVGKAVTNPDWLMPLLDIGVAFISMGDNTSIIIENDSLTLSGTVLTQRQKQDIVKSAGELIPKIWALNNNLKTLPNLEIARNGSEITVNGVVADPQVIGNLVQRVKSHHPDNKILNALTTNQNIGKPEWITRVIDFSHHLNKLGAKSSIKMMDGHITLRGEAVNNTAIMEIVNEANTIAPEYLTVINELAVAPSFSLQINDAEMKLNGLMPSQRVIDRMMETVNSNFPQTLAAVGNSVTIGDAISNPLWLNAIINFLPELKAISPFSITVKNREVYIEGVALNTQAKQKFDKIAAHIANKDLKIIIDLIIPQKITFEIDSYIITPYGKHILQESFRQVLASQSTIIEIAGHADSTGEAFHNCQLSWMRAEAIKKYLVDELKLDANNFTVSGYSDSVPIEENTNDESRASNRRVEFYTEAGSEAKYKPCLRNINVK